MVSDEAVQQDLLINVQRQTILFGNLAKVVVMVMK